MTIKVLIEAEVRKALRSLNEGIVHLDKLRPEQMLQFVDSWNLDKSVFHVTEKIDGSPMRFGLENGRMFLGSKSNKWYSAQEVPEVHFLSSFKKYFEHLQSIPLDSIVQKLSQQYGFEYSGNFLIDGEAVASYDHNIIMYDEAKIGDGIFVIFNTKNEQGSIQNPEMWKALAGELNQHSNVKFFSVPEISLDSFEFDNKLLVSLKGLIEKHGNFLKKPARKPEDKELKKQLLQAVREIGLSFKKDFFEKQKSIPGVFGPDIEGVVFTDPNGKLVKLVDTDTFLTAGNANRFYINGLIKLKGTLFKSLKKSPEDFESLVSEYETEVLKLEDDFKQNGDTRITIPRKRQETIESFEHVYDVISKYKSKLQSSGPEEASRAVLDRLIEKKNRPGALLFEGGNVFDEMNSVVPKSLLHANVQNALDEIGLQNIAYEVVGNKTKDFFGDIDISLDSKDIAEIVESPESEADFWNKLEDYLELRAKNGYSVNKGFKQFHTLAPLVDSSGAHVNGFNPDGTRTEDPGWIQFDFFVGNREWMKDLLSGSGPDSKFKAVYRNLLLAAIFSAIRWETEDGLKQRYTLDFKNGLKKITYEEKTTKTGRTKNVKVDEEIVPINSNELASMLFGEGVGWSDISTIEGLWHHFDNSFKYPELRNDIVDSYKKTLSKMNREVPDFV